MTTAVATLTPKTEHPAAILEKLVVGGDLRNLTSAERLQYYNHLCQSLDLNPMTRPFEYITLDGRLTLYVRKDCTEQLRKRDNVSITIKDRQMLEGVYLVTVQAESNGRTDESIGAVALTDDKTGNPLTGKNLANAIMKAETKAKRRVTLSICGLGFISEEEARDIPGAELLSADAAEQLPALPPGEPEVPKEMSDAEMARLQQALLAQRNPPTAVDSPKEGAPGPAHTEPAPPTKTTWTHEEWTDVCHYFGSSTELEKLRDVVVASMNLKGTTYTLREAGRRVFMERARAEAAKRQITLEV